MLLCDASVCDCLMWDLWTFSKKVPTPICCDFAAFVSKIQTRHKEEAFFNDIEKALYDSIQSQSTIIFELSLFSLLLTNIKDLMIIIIIMLKCSFSPALFMNAIACVCVFEGKSRGKVCRQRSAMWEYNFM